MKNILYTRLIRPKSENILHRNKNIEDKLDRISENKLTIVKGGAAVGKSTLISNYIGLKDKYMWLSLDENSDDLSCFWTYVLHGLKINIEDFSFYIDMISPLVKREEIFELISSLINELIKDEELFIILDDFHYIEDKFLLETIEYFILNSSDNLHFVLISRYDIKLYLANILMKGGIVDINSEDFNLTLEETEEFIKNTFKKNIDNYAINEIFSISEGWIGAIKLLLTVLGSKKNIKNIPKGNKLFIDYMNNEIISCLSKEEIDFLIKTSPLSYVNPSIYKYIDNDKDGFLIINNLIEKNMLIITIDEDGKIFRYHNILRQYLTERFDKYEVYIKNEIIDKLTVSLIKNKNYDEAVRIFINYKRYDDAIKIIEKNAHNIVSTKILNEFPLEYYNKSVDLAFISIFINYLNLDYERCSLIINSTNFNETNKLGNSIKVFGIILNNSYVEQSHFDFPKEIDSSLNILTKIAYYILASWALGFIDEYGKSFEMMELIKEANKELNNSYVDLISKYNKVSLLENMGKLNESLKGYKELSGKLSEKNYKSFSVFINVGLPGVYIKMLRDKEAEELLLEAQKILKEYRGRVAFSTLEIGINYNLAEVKYIQGNIDECEKLLNNIDNYNKDSYAYIQMLALKIRLLLFENRIKMEECDEFISAYKNKYQKSSCSDILDLTYGIVLFEKSQYKESLNEFNKITSNYRKNRIGYLLVYSLVWKAILLSKLEPDNARECINILKEAIFYSRHEDILFPFYKNRKHLKEIIQKVRVKLLDDKDNQEFVKKLCDLIGIKEENEVLSTREIDVLQALIDGLSNREIGEKLFISISTVKTHIINIYSKLGVKNRVEAVNEGRKFIE